MSALIAAANVSLGAPAQTDGAPLAASGGPPPVSVALVAGCAAAGALVLVATLAIAAWIYGVPRQWHKRTAVAVRAPPRDAPGTKAGEVAPFSENPMRAVIGKRSGSNSKSRLRGVIALQPLPLTAQSCRDAMDQ